MKRCLVQTGKEHAKEAMINRQPVIPSKHFVNTFMCSFAEDPIFNILKEDVAKSVEKDVEVYFLYSSFDCYLTFFFYSNSNKTKTVISTKP